MTEFMHGAGEDLIEQPFGGQSMRPFYGAAQFVASARAVAGHCYVHAATSQPRVSPARKGTTSPNRAGTVHGFRRKVTVFCGGMIP